MFQGKFKATHLSGDYALPTVSAYVNLNYKHHQIDIKQHLVKSSIFEYLNTEKSDRICDPSEIQNIITETSGLDGYIEYIKHASIHFADAKGNTINMSNFEF